MASIVQTALSTNGANSSPSSPLDSTTSSTKETPSPQPANPPAVNGTRAEGRKYRHATAYHSNVRPSCLSRDSEKPPSFMGFRNLTVIVLVVMNLRLMVENFMKYGVLICVRCHDYRKQDLQLGLILSTLVPCHLIVAYIIEFAVARSVKTVIGRRKRDQDESVPQQAKELESFRRTWRYIAFAHTTNASLCLLVSTYVVYYHIHHPAIGTICQAHALVVWLKNCSYAFTNRDLRHAVLRPSTNIKLPEIYKSCPYPQNITVQNLCYFWMAPTLVYQPVYPRTTHIRWSFVAKRLLEMAGLGVFIWLTSAQYASPVLRNSLDKIATLNWASIVERIMKLSTISLIIWLAGFYALFQSYLNALAEVLRFGDREFYGDWWNSASVGAYWRSWNKPVYHFMKRHIFSPLVGRGWRPFTASMMVFAFSAMLHEILVGVPTHNIIGVAFVGMLFQLPLIAATLPLERMEGPTGKIIGNSVFWVSFCLVGQPLGALLYFFAWQAKYGSVSKVQI